MLHVYLLCHNEAVLLPHAVEHYRLKHMAWLGLPFIVQKYQQRYERGKEQMAQNLGTHYTDDVTKVTAEFALRRSVARRFSERPYNATPSLLWRVVRRLRRPIA